RQIMTGKQLMDACDNAFIEGSAESGKIVVKGTPVDSALHLWRLQYNFQLRAEDQPFAGNGIVERFFAQTIACDEEFPILLVPPRKGEHSTHAVDTVDAVLLIGMNDNLGV